MVEHATLTVMKSDGSADESQSVTVHFNPENLSISYRRTGPNTTQSKDSRSGTTSSGSQQSTGFEVSLSRLQLYFDTTQTGEDVRNITLKIAGMIVIVGQNASPRVRFHWGSFLFYGTIDSMQETLDYFNAHGIPLRATVDLTLTMVDERRDPTSVSAGFGLGASAGFAAGTSAGFSAGASAGVSASASASASISAGVNVSASASFSASASAGLNASAGFSASAGASASLSAGAAVGTAPLSLSASGESVQSMAARAGVDWKVVAAANNIDNPRQLQAGAVVNLNAGFR